MDKAFKWTTNGLEQNENTLQGLMVWWDCAHSSHGEQSITKHIHWTWPLFLPRENKEFDGILLMNRFAYNGWELINFMGNVFIDTIQCNPLVYDVIYLWTYWLVNQWFSIAKGKFDLRLLIPNRHAYTSDVVKFLTHGENMSCFPNIS